MACVCEISEEDQCCAPCAKRNRCRSACQVYSGWDSECRDSRWRVRQMERRFEDEMFLDPT